MSTQSHNYVGTLRPALSVRDRDGDGEHSCDGESVQCMAAFSKSMASWV